VNRGGKTELRVLYESHFLAVDHNFKHMTGDKVEDRKEIILEVWYMQYTTQTQLSKPRRCWLQHNRSHSFTKHHGIVCHPDWCHKRLVLDKPGAMGHHMRCGPVSAIQCALASDLEGVEERELAATAASTTADALEAAPAAQRVRWSLL
jgi:hypothetical protein